MPFVLLPVLRMPFIYLMLSHNSYRKFIDQQSHTIKWNMVLLNIDKPIEKLCDRNCKIVLVFISCWWSPLNTDLPRGILFFIAKKRMLNQTWLYLSNALWVWTVIVRNIDKKFPRNLLLKKQLEHFQFQIFGVTSFVSGDKNSCSENADVSFISCTDKQNWTPFCVTAFLSWKEIKRDQFYESLHYQMRHLIEAFRTAYALQFDHNTNLEFIQSCIFETKQTMQIMSEISLRQKIIERFGSFIFVDIYARTLLRALDDFLRLIEYSISSY